jgi:hypothetical protein
MVRSRGELVVPRRWFPCAPSGPPVSEDTAPVTSGGGDPTEWGETNVLALAKYELCARDANASAVRRLAPPAAEFPLRGCRGVSGLGFRGAALEEVLTVTAGRACIQHHKVAISKSGELFKP